MRIIRKVNDSGYTKVPNETLRDRSLSWKARGLLAFLLTHTEGWHIDSELLAEECEHAGRDAVRSGLRELVDAGYLVRRKARNDKGQWVTECEVYDRPQDPAPAEPVPLFPAPENPSPAVNPQVSPETDNPAPGEPAPGEPAVGWSGANKKTKKKNPPQTTSSSEPTPTNTEDRPPAKPGPTVRRRLPADFTLTRSRGVYAQELGLDDAEVRQEWQQFVDHHTARATAFADWEAAWRQWARRAVGYRERRGPAPSRAGAPPRNIRTSYARDDPGRGATPADDDAEWREGA